MTKCALWYWRYHSPSYELCEDEAEAASMAVSIEDADDGSVVGVQFPDGRIVKVGDWDAYRAEEERRSREWRSRSAVPPTPTRTIREPFTGQTLTVDTDEPPWLGQSS